MQGDVRLLSEEDLALIHALQLQPRASWSVLGRALDVDPVTVARRWSRLATRGEAWIGLSPGPRMFNQVCLAFIEIDCALGSATAVAGALNRHPHMLTVERTVSGHDILATVATRDLAAMSRYTLDHLPAIPGVTAVRARLVTHMFTEAGRWRIDALAPGQRAQLTATTKSAPTGRDVRQVTPADRAVLAHLAQDGRASHQALATALKTSASTVKRRIDQLTGLGLLSRLSMQPGYAGGAVAERPCQYPLQQSPREQAGMEPAVKRRQRQRATQSAGRRRVRRPADRPGRGRPPSWREG
ncbi:AsnC family transcriptional regulator [Streptomyces sp. NPDC057424]|uniref:AsnC family transcriptional regulator n=1 Tax=Streptomyces sp. NPDC057424 TaxID=3346127 RepID=UPI0036739D57